MTIKNDFIAFVDNMVLNDIKPKIYYKGDRVNRFHGFDFEIDLSIITSQKHFDALVALKTIVENIGN